MPRHNRRFRAVKTSPPRYEEDVIGLPSSAMVLTNSDRRTAWCQRRWFYAEGLGLSSGASGPMYFGSCVHAAMENAFRYWMVADAPMPNDWLTTPVGYVDACLHCGDRHHPNNDSNKQESCIVCEGTGLGPYATALQYMKGAFEPDEWATETARLHDVIFGYFQRYGAGPMTDFKVVAVELAVAIPILSPKSGKVYRSTVPIIQEPAESHAFGRFKKWRVARAGQRETATNVSFPWYQCGRLDAVLQHRRTGELWVHEFKTSANPVSYGRDLQLDTQIPGYMRALNRASQLGCFGSDKPKVAGYQWDVLGSRKHTKPRVLKSGKVSLSKGQKIASWHWEAFLNDIGPETYTDSELEELKAKTIQLRETVDSTLYHREFGTFSPELDQRYAVELFTEARRFANMRRMAVAIDPFDESEIGQHFPRTPVCRIQGHGCAFKGPCLHDSQEARNSFEERSPIVWMTRSFIGNQPQKEEKEIVCPF